jgi:hypothetical protein
MAKTYNYFSGKLLVAKVDHLIHMKGQWWAFGNNVGSISWELHLELPLISQVRMDVGK